MVEGYPFDSKEVYVEIWHDIQDLPVGCAVGKA